ADVFLKVLRKFPELTDKTIFVIAGNGVSARFASVLMARTDLPTNVVPIKVVIRPGDSYTLDMHRNKFGHREIASQILKHMQQQKEGRDCLSAQSDGGT